MARAPGWRASSCSWSTWSWPPPSSCTPEGVAAGRTHRGVWSISLCAWPGSVLSAQHTDAARDGARARDLRGEERQAPDEPARQPVPEAGHVHGSARVHDDRTARPLVKGQRTGRDSDGNGAQDGTGESADDVDPPSAGRYAVSVSHPHVGDEHTSAPRVDGQRTGVAAGGNGAQGPAVPHVQQAHRRIPGDDDVTRTR